MPRVVERHRRLHQPLTCTDIRACGGVEGAQTKPRNQHMELAMEMQSGQHMGMEMEMEMEMESGQQRGSAAARVGAGWFGQRAPSLSTASKA
jgi:hypothetical protein